MSLDTDADVDDVAVSMNKVSVTPIHIDMTNYTMLEELKKWNLSL